MSKCSTTHAKYSPRTSTCFPKFTIFLLEDFWITMKWPFSCSFSFIASFLPVIYDPSSSAVAPSVEEATQSAGSQHLLTLIFQGHVIKELPGAWQIIGCKPSNLSGPLTMHIQTNCIVCGHPGSTRADHRYGLIVILLAPMGKSESIHSTRRNTFSLSLGQDPQSFLLCLGTY